LRFALCILVALQIADAGTTAYGLSSGLGREANPGSAWILGNAGIAGLAAAKAVVLAYVVGLYLWLPAWRGLLAFVIRAGAIYTAYLVFSNLRVGGLI
jgi:hypothetical protein